MIIFYHIYLCVYSILEPPEAPRDVLIMQCLGNTVELNWTKGENGGSPVNNYLVQFNTSESPENWKNYYDEIAVDSTSIHVNLSPWGTYSFRLLARNDVGYSKPSNPTRQVCTTPPERPGGNPRDVRTLTHKKGKLIVTWTVCISHIKNHYKLIGQTQKLLFVINVKIL